MNRSVLFPFHDPAGICIPHLQAIIPKLKGLFDGAYLGIDKPTRDQQADFIHYLSDDPFFKIAFIESDSVFGDHCLAACTLAVENPGDHVIHFCFVDHLAFALQSNFQNSFIEDITSTTSEKAPRLYQRSSEAWKSHPANYRDIEGMAIRASELVLHRSFDLTWCHLALTARQLASILPLIKRRDLVMLGEIVLLLKDQITTQEVDWLAWEDPFILGSEARLLKAQREASHSETLKRLSYVIPTLQMLYEFSSNQKENKSNSLRSFEP